MYTRSPHKPISKDALIACLEHRRYCSGGDEVIEEVRKRTFQSITIVDAKRTEENICGLGGVVSQEKVEEFDSYCGHALEQALIALGISTRDVYFSSCVRFHDRLKLL